jgi:hypothetical protein
VVLRSKFNEKYFSSVPSWVNAYGFEKRVGGRMGLFAYIDISECYTSTHQTIPSRTVLLGSIHKVQAETYPDIVARINKKGVVGSVIAGDQIRSTCGSLGLASVEDATELTFPASCYNKGDQHGDIICSSMALVQPIDSILPCISFGNASYTISDHTIYIAIMTL